MPCETTQNLLRIDETTPALLYQLVNGGKAYFLSRPRRFGKSLICSTIGATWKDEKSSSPFLSWKRGRRSEPIRRDIFPSRI